MLVWDSGDSFKLDTKGFEKCWGFFPNRVIFGWGSGSVTYRAAPENLSVGAGRVFMCVCPISISVAVRASVALGRPREGELRTKKVLY